MPKVKHDYDFDGEYEGSYYDDDGGGDDEWAQLDGDECGGDGGRRRVSYSERPPFTADETASLLAARTPKLIELAKTELQLKDVLKGAFREVRQLCDE